MKTFKGGTAVITGAGSGFGLETSRLAAKRGMNVVMADVQQDALERAAAEIRALGADVLPFRLDVTHATEVEALGAATKARFGAPNIVFNNAGVGAGGLIWENSAADWAWVIGVNVMGVAHGIRVFTPMMLEAAAKDPSYEGHIVNTASMAGMINGMGFSPYSASKFAVVSMSEGLAAQVKPLGIGVSVLCPGFVRTGIGESGRNRPQRYGPTPTLDPASPAAAVVAEIARRLQTGLDPAAVAARVLAAIRNDELYVFTHPEMRGEVDQRFAAIQAAMDKAAR